MIIAPATLPDRGLGPELQCDQVQEGILVEIVPVKDCGSLLSLFSNFHFFRAHPPLLSSLFIAFLSIFARSRNHHG